MSMSKDYQTKKKKATALKYIEMAKQEATLIAIFEKEIREHRKKLTKCLDYLRAGKKRKFLRKISQYEYEWIGDDYEKNCERLF